MKRILITGANSFVGKNIIKFSENKEIDVISLFEKKPETINFKNYDVIIHLVAIVHQSRRIKDADYFRINRDLCIAIAKGAKNAGVRHFIFLSTIKVYGKFVVGSSSWNERSLCMPEDSYGKSKYEAEQLLQKMADQNFIVSIIRTPLVYGEGVKANMYGILKLIDKMPILPFKNIDNKRNFTSAENLTAFIDRIIAKQIPGIFIAMDEKALSTTELVNYISKYLGKKIILFKIPKFLITIGVKIIPKIFDRLYGSFEMDNKETLRILEFKPPFTNEHGIEKMVLAYKRLKADNQ